MSKLELLAHGQRVRIEYASIPGEQEGAAGCSTDEDRPDGQTAGIVKRFRKDKYSPVRGQALGWIKAIYSEAIEYTGMTKELRGYGFLIALFFGAMGLIGGSIFSLSPFNDIDGSEPWFYQLTTWLLVFPAGLAGISFGAWITAFALRADLFKPADLPIIFDRKNRKVYRILREEKPGWLGVFKPWPVIACEYDWDLVDAEHEAELLTTGATMHRNHFLMFAVRKSADDPTIIDSFQIANASSLSEALVPAMWEHIRRFMEEGGPHLPAPDEPLACMEAPPSWWHSLGATGPFGHGYMEKWSKQFGYMLFMHIALPVTLPMFLLWGTGNWLSYKTAIKVEWPEAVKHAIGRAVTTTAR